jgi:hypothetical protein
MTDDRLDLSALDPTRDAPRFDAAVRAVLADAAARRTARVDPLIVVSRWSRPLAAAAALVAMLSGAALARGSQASASAGQTASASTSRQTVVDALISGSTPNPEDLVFSSFTTAAR